MTTASKYAVIDVGSNSVRLLVASVDSRGFIKPIHKESETCRLAQGIIGTGALSEDAMQRTAAAVRRLKAIAAENSVECVYVFGTAAVRESQNRSAFVSLLNRETSVLIDVLSGEQEAAIGFAGTYRAGRRALLDIGGGSTEFSIGSGENITDAVSVPIGAVKALEIYKLGRYPDTLVMEAMRQWARKNLLHSMERITAEFNAMNSPVITGVGGTITSLAAIDLSLVQYDAEKVQNYELKGSSISRIYNTLVSLESEARGKLPGLQPQRADIIIGGTVILQELMGLLKASSIRVSDSDNLEGYLRTKLDLVNA